MNQCIGIILDNAIEEAVLTKEKYIYIKLILDDNNKVTFECQNTISKKIDIDSIGIEGISSKKNHMGIGTTYLRKQTIFDITNIIRENNYIVKLSFKI